MSCLDSFGGTKIPQTEIKTINSGGFTLSAATMDITSFVVQGRDKALLYGDYATYHSQLAKRLLNSRKKLGLATKNRGKFKPRDDITAQEIAETREYGAMPSTSLNALTYRQTCLPVPPHQ